MLIGILNIVSILAAVVAAFFAWRAICNARKIANSTFIYNVYKNYGSQEFHEALRTLREWKKQHSTNFDTIWSNAINDENNEFYNTAIRVNGARRIVKYHFVAIERSMRAGSIDSKTFKVLCENMGTNILFEIIKPLEAMESEVYWIENFKKL